MADYIIGVGGTGARCMVPVLYLAAAGLFDDGLHLFQIDPDQANGNGSDARAIFERYAALARARHAAGTFGRNGYARAFTTHVNTSDVANDRIAPFAWRKRGAHDTAFQDLIDYRHLDSNVKRFVDLFYAKSDLAMTLEKGFRGRTSVGAVALGMELADTARERGSGLCELIAALHRDLHNGPVRVVVIGSVFGGSGAAALPTLPNFLRTLPSDLIGTHIDNLRFACVLLTPYFSYPSGTDGPAQEAAFDSTHHMMATYAALSHHAHVPLEYDDIYIVGAPEQQQTADAFIDGGEKQRNRPHYAELIAALAARTFLEGSPAPEKPREPTIHFATDRRGEESEGLAWSTLPIAEGTRIRLQRDLTSFSVMAYFYARVMHDALLAASNLDDPYVDAPWHRDHFRAATLSREDAGLDELHRFFDDYLRWLHGVMRSAKGHAVRLFDADVLNGDGKSIEELADRIGRVPHWDNAEFNAPMRGRAYHEILRRMDRMPPSNGTAPTVGRLISLLDHASRSFCADSDGWFASTARRRRDHVPQAQT